MTNRERVVALLERVPDYKMGYALAYVQGIAADEEFCPPTLGNCENAPDNPTPEECKN